jgi:hypothetical protein
MTPVIVEGLFKRSIWHQLFDIRRGLRHPRLYAAADTILSITSAYTGSKSQWLMFALYQGQINTAACPISL